MRTTLGWLTCVETIDSCSALTCDDWPPSWLSTFTATVQPRHLAARHASPQPRPIKSQEHLRRRQMCQRSRPGLPVLNSSMTKLPCLDMISHHHCSRSAALPRHVSPIERERGRRHPCRRGRSCRGPRACPGAGCAARGCALRLPAAESQARGRAAAHPGRVCCGRSPSAACPSRTATAAAAEESAPQTEHAALSFRPLLQGVTWNQKARLCAYSTWTARAAHAVVAPDNWAA